MLPAPPSRRPRRGAGARRLLLLAAAWGILVPAAHACVNVGVYQDNPPRTLPALAKAVGPGVSTLSIYVTTGKPIDPKVLTLVKARRLRLIVSWLPDNGSDGANKPKYRLSRINAGRFDAQIRALAKQLKPLRNQVLFRPMPEPNTPWHAWSGMVNRNTPQQYVKAWKRIRTIVRKTAGKRVKLLWTPYARGVPDSDTNGFAAYFPGTAYVDQIGLSAYNFGQAQGLAWSDPAPLFEDAYQALTALAPGKPFWIAETGSTETGGDKAQWIKDLASLGSELPTLRGVVWFDVKEKTGDFRIRANRQTIAAFRSLLGGRCK
jgi:hypothetical protein